MSLTGDVKSPPNKRAPGKSRKPLPTASPRLYADAKPVTTPKLPFHAHYLCRVGLPPGVERPVQLPSELRCLWAPVGLVAPGGPLTLSLRAPIEHVRDGARRPPPFPPFTLSLSL